MIIPYQKLPQETLTALIENYITREGTDYGLQEIDSDQKVEQVKAAIVSGGVVIVFDVASESTSLLSSHEARALLSLAEEAEDQQGFGV